MSDATPAAGYYPDPTGSGHQRYWDGRQWTAHLTPATPAAPPVPALPSVTAARLAALQPFRPASRTAVLPDATRGSIVRKRPPLRISRIAFGVYLIAGTAVAAYVNTQPLSTTASPTAVHATR